MDLKIDKKEWEQFKKDIEAWNDDLLNKVNIELARIKQKEDTLGKLNTIKTSREILHILDCAIKRMVEPTLNSYFLWKNGEYRLNDK